MTESRFDPDRLPAAIRGYIQTPHGRGDSERVAAAFFTSDARVVDERAEYRGTDAIAHWFDHAGSEYSYTTTYYAQNSSAPDRWTLTVRLEGNFPGGTADLSYRFRLRGDRIAELIIEP